MSQQESSSRKSSETDQEKDDASIKATIKNDLLGAEDWRRSKIGFITGFSAFRRMGQSVSSNVSTSVYRTSSLFNSIARSTEDIPSLPRHSGSYDPYERFIQAQEINGTNEQDIQVVLTNTVKSFYLYVALTVGGLSYITVDIFMHPTMATLDMIAKFGLVFLGAALIFRSAYTNFMFRHRALVLPRDFIKSGDYTPKAF
jgi:hypothetical protein